MTGNIVAGKNVDATSSNVLSLIYHVRTPKIDLAGYIIAGRNKNIVKFPKTAKFNRNPP